MALDASEAAAALGTAWDARRAVTVLVVRETVSTADEEGRCPDGALTLDPDLPECPATAAWEWDGSRWTLAWLGGRDVGPQPDLTGTETAAFVGWDEEIERVVLVTLARSRFAGDLDEDGECEDDLEGLEGGCYEWLEGADVWEWDGLAWEPRPVSDPEGDGDPEYGCGLVYDRARRQRLFVDFSFADESGRGPAPWAWTGASWRLLAPADPEDDGGPLDCLGVVYDTRIGAPVLLEPTWAGGVLPGGPCPNGQLANERGECLQLVLWRWTGGSWARIHDQPPHTSWPQSMVGLAWDPERGAVATVERVVTYSPAAGGSGPDRCDDGVEPEDGVCGSVARWDWFGRGWRREQPPTAAEGLGNVTPVALLSSRSLGGLLLVGFEPEPPGVLGQCCDGRGATDWTLEYACLSLGVWRWRDGGWEPAGDPAPAACRPTLADFDQPAWIVDEPSGVLWMVRTGEGGVSDVWRFDSSGWTRADSEGGSPPLGWRFVGAADPEDGGALVVSRQSVDPEPDGSCPEGASPDELDLAECASDFLWRPGPSGWESTRLAGPAEAAFGLLAGVPGRGRLFLHDEEALAWELLGTRWRALPATDVEDDGSPEPFEGEGARFVAVDRAGDVPLVLRGRSLWTWDYGTDAAPSQVLTVPVAAAGLPEGAALEEVAVAWSAGGEGYDDETSGVGARLLVWDAGRWLEAAAHAAPPDAPEPLRWSTDDAAVLARLPVGPDGILGFAVRTVLPNGRGERPARVTTAEVEVALRYRLR